MDANSGGLGSPYRCLKMYVADGSKQYVQLPQAERYLALFLMKATLVRSLTGHIKTGAILRKQKEK